MWWRHTCAAGAGPPSAFCSRRAQAGRNTTEPAAPHRQPVTRCSHINGSRSHRSTARTGLGVTAGTDGRIYAVSGNTGGNAPALPVAEVYDPTSGAWSQIAPITQPRTSFVLATGSSGAIYAFGGFCRGRPVDEIDEYTPSSGKWTSPGLLPTSLIPIAGATGPGGRIYILAVVANAANTGHAAERLSRTAHRQVLGLIWAPLRRGHVSVLRPRSPATHCTSSAAKTCHQMRSPVRSTPTLLARTIGASRQRCQSRFSLPAPPSRTTAEST